MSKIMSDKGKGFYTGVIFSGLWVVSLGILGYISDADNSILQHPREIVFCGLLLLSLSSAMMTVEWIIARMTHLIEKVKKNDPKWRPYDL